MDPHSDNDDLFVIPCCSTKIPGGKQLEHYSDDLQKSVSPKAYKNLLSARSDVLHSLREDSRYLAGKYLKNTKIQDGPEFGTARSKGQYLPAIERYTGTLYSQPLGFVESVRKYLGDPSKPKVLILSALYGPLDPFCPIQDYNLKMTDRPAYKTWKKHFSIFLEDYVRKHGTKRIRLYLGGSTGYFRVAKAAVQHLKDKQLIDRAIQYDVKDGSTYLTPYTHGRLVHSHLEGRKDIDLERNVTPIEL